MIEDKSKGNTRFADPGGIAVSERQSIDHVATACESYRLELCITYCLVARGRGVKKRLET